MTIAQQLGLSGKIKDSKSKDAIVHASVTLLNSDLQLIDGVMTDNSGYFSFQKVKNGDYIVRVKFIGYNQMDTSIRLIKTEWLELGSIYLHTAQHEISEVQVSGVTAGQKHKSDRQTYKASQYKNAVGGTALDIVKNLPSASLDGNGQISMRGNTGLIVLVNGKPSFLDPVTMMNQIAGC